MNKRKKREKKNKQCEDVDICTEMNKNSRVEKKEKKMNSFVRRVGKLLALSDMFGKDQLSSKINYV